MLLPQKHTTVTHPALHPALTKHSVIVSKTSPSTFASPCMQKKQQQQKNPEKSVYQCELTGHTQTGSLKADQVLEGI